MSTQIWTTVAVQDKYKEYQKGMKIPPYTTEEGVSFLGGSLVSLENTTISDAFISDVAGFGSYTFTMNSTQYCPNGFGVSVETVKFTASLPFVVSEDAINVRLSLMLELVNVA